MLGANDNTGWFQSNFCAVRAKVALRRGAFVWINVDGIVGTGLHAGFAADTAFRTEIDDAVSALVHRRDRADRDAGGILAVIATGDLKNAAGVREGSLLDIFHPSAVDAQWDMVFGLARDSAGVTADALAVIDDESVSHPEGLFRGRHRSAGSLSIVSDLNTRVRLSP